MKAPKSLVHKDGSVYEFEKVLCPLEKISFCYRWIQPDFKASVVLSPKKIEREFINRPRPKGEVVRQEPFGCVQASVAMLLQLPLEKVKEAFGENEVVDSAQIILALRDLGFQGQVHEEFPNAPCIFSVESLNVKGMNHCLYFDGAEILDPQMDNDGMRWYASDWCPQALSGFDFISVVPLRN